ncbi:MAG: BCCT family transporter, partial [Anaerovorax sp.]|nr:BCCT family transporter [Anaerovorax sp.]
MEKNLNMKSKGKYDLSLIIVSLALLVLFVIMMLSSPDTTLNGINKVFNKVVAIFGPMLEVFTFVMLYLSFYLGLGRYRNVKLGDSDPEYSMFSYVAM